MEWPSGSFQAQAWGAGVSHAGVDPENREAIVAHLLACGVERAAFEPLLPEIAACARARSAHVGEVLAAPTPPDQQIAHYSVRPADLARLIELVRDGFVSNTAGKKIFAAMVETGDPPARIAEREGLVQVRDASELEKWVDEVLAENPGEAKRFRDGEKKLLGVLVGQVMKKSKGRADPRRVNQLLSERAGS